MSNELIQRYLQKREPRQIISLNFYLELTGVIHIQFSDFVCFFIGVAIVVAKPCKGVCENRNSNSGAMSLNKSFNEKYNVYARAL